ncbi:hypothetical protein EYF80_013316 [Liparis tanakae]|uniref:Uncharacterized protein n=1 Tax=Liparis tanakae TaxID=230148 RepID=A0A4Z2IF91_9TELE|nr:hypothetical protein EYF80_013316 [Liparis tanakae]
MRSHRQEVQRSVVHDVFADSGEVHDLSDAEQRRDDQSPAAGALQEGGGPLLTHYFTVEKQREGWLSNSPSQGFTATAAVEPAAQPETNAQ